MDCSEKEVFINKYKSENLHRLIDESIKNFIKQCDEYNLTLYSLSIPCSQKWSLYTDEQPIYENQGKIIKDREHPFWKEIMNKPEVYWEEVILENGNPLFKDVGWRSDNTIWLKI